MTPPGWVEPVSVLGWVTWLTVLVFHDELRALARGVVRAAKAFVVAAWIEELVRRA